MKKILTLLLTLSCMTSYGQSALKVNQVGYHTEGQKIAVAEQGIKSKTFTLKDNKGRTVWKGKAVRTAVSPFSDKTRQNKTSINKNLLTQDLQGNQSNGSQDNICDDL